MTATIDLTNLQLEIQKMIRSELLALLGNTRQGAGEAVPLKEAAVRYGVSEAWMRKVKKDHPEAFGRAGTKILVIPHEFEKLIASS